MSLFNDSMAAQLESYSEHYIDIPIAVFRAISEP